MEPTDKIITAKELFSQDSIRQKFVDMLGKRAPQFITSVLQCVASNNLLKNADPNSIYNAAAVAATLDLPLNNQLGFAYIVPYNISEKVDGNWQTRVVAQFQIGWKGYIQLGQRTGMYQKIAATRILEGQLVKANPLEGFEFNFEAPWTADKPRKVIGYASHFRLVNGFEKTVYMSVEELTSHGKKYSKSFDTAKGLWKTDPETMCLKTVLKQNLSKYGPMSIELQTAYVTDQALIKDANTLEVGYPDNEQESIDKAHERISLLIDQAHILADLEPLREHADLDQQTAIARKELEIRKSYGAGHTKDNDERIKALEALLAGN